MTPSPADNSPEIVNPEHPRGPFRLAVFDFDGTLSLLRGNWQGIMIPMMVEALAATGTIESAKELTALVEEFVTRLTGQPTIRQMEALAAELVRRGNSRPDPQIYLARYLDTLLSRTEERISVVQSGKTSREEFLIPGTLRLLERLRSSGLLLAIASGTELPHVQREARILNIDHYFTAGIFGPAHSTAVFSKETVMRQLLEKHSLRPDQLIAIGDGPAEILAAKSLGALALGLATDEVHCDGRPNALKRHHLLQSGADVIVSDYQQLPSLLQLLLNSAPGSITPK